MALILYLFGFFQPDNNVNWTGEFLRIAHGDGHVDYLFCYKSKRNTNTLFIWKVTKDQLSIERNCKNENW